MKKSASELQDEIRDALGKFRHRHWKHYKGGIYEFINVCVDTDDGELRVRYRRVDGPDFDHLAESGIEYVRPLREWFEDVEPEPGIFVPRFKATRKVEVWQERP